MGYMIGTDVGGTNIVCGLLDPSGEMVAKKKWATESSKGSHHIIRSIAEQASALVAEAGLTWGDIVSLGVGTPGIVDPERGVTIAAGNLQWTNVPLAAELQALVGVPVYVDNDVRMYVYGEAMQGAGQGFEHVFGLTLGTGIAAAFVQKGQLYHGGGFMAGEIGHVRMRGLTHDCPCGGTGCLETLVSAPGIARRAREVIASGRASMLQERHPDLSTITAFDVSLAYDEGDSVAIEVLHEVGKYLGEALSHAVTILSPDVVVIGGGAAQAGERIFAPMREEMKNSLYVKYWERVQIRTAQLLDDAGVIGSAVNAKTKALAATGQSQQVEDRS